MDKKVEKILAKFFMNEANIDDLEALTDWLKKDEHKKIFKDYARLNYAVDINTNVFDTEKTKREFLNRIQKDKTPRLKIYKSLKYVAAAVIIFSFGYFLQQGMSVSGNTSNVVNNLIRSGTDKATLTLETGEEIALIKGTFFQTNNAISNGSEIIYNVNSNETKVKYNYLTIPQGGQFFVQLSDGTKIWLNSESQLKYPVSFIENQTRQVELVYGEAYFDVSPSVENNGTKFKVYQNEQEVQVLGTEFNIKAYKDETSIYTTLVEGKVLVKTDDIKLDLKPSQQSLLDLNTSNIKMKLVDVFNETSWKDGVFSFENQSLKEILKVLARWYDIEVVFKNKEIENEKFIGVLEREKNIEEILSSIKGFGIIKDYNIQGKIIILE